MDRGELFKKTFSVEPVNSGFIVMVLGETTIPKRLAFSNLDDLMTWLNEQRPAETKYANTPVSNSASTTSEALLNTPNIYPSVGRLDVTVKHHPQAT